MSLLRIRQLTPLPTTSRVSKSPFRCSRPLNRHFSVRRIVPSLRVSSENLSQTLTGGSEPQGILQTSSTDGDLSVLDGNTIDESIMGESVFDCEETTVSIVVVGASGDLAKKKIFPALFALYYQGMLPNVGFISGLENGINNGVFRGFRFLDMLAVR